MLAGQAGSIRLWWKGMFNQKVMSQAHVSSWVFSSWFCPFISSPGQISHPPGTATCFGSVGAALEVPDCSALQGFLLGFQVVAPTACSSLTALCPQPPGSVRRTSSPVRTATASGACGTVMVTMTAVTIAMSSVVSAVPGRRAGWLAMGREPSNGSRTAQTSNLPGCVCV